MVYPRLDKPDPQVSVEGCVSIQLPTDIQPQKNSEMPPRPHCNQKAWALKAFSGTQGAHSTQLQLQEPWTLFQGGAAGWGLCPSRYEHFAFSTRVNFSLDHGITTSSGR